MLGGRKAHFQHAFLNANFVLTQFSVVQNRKSIHISSGYQLVLRLTLLFIPLLSHHKFVILMRLFQGKAGVKQQCFLRSLTISSLKVNKQHNKTKKTPLLNLLFLFSVLVNLKPPNLLLLLLKFSFISKIKIGN